MTEKVRCKGCGESVELSETRKVGAWLYCEACYGSDFS